MTSEEIKRAIERNEKIMIVGIILIILSTVVLSVIPITEIGWFDGLSSTILGGMFGIVGAVLFVNNLSQLIKFHLKKIN